MATLPVLLSSVPGDKEQGITDGNFSIMLTFNQEVTLSGTPAITLNGKKLDNMVIDKKTVTLPVTLEKSTDYELIRFYPFRFFPFGLEQLQQHQSGGRVVEKQRFGRLYVALEHSHERRTDYTFRPGNDPKQTNFDVSRIADPQSDEYKSLIKT